MNQFLFRLHASFQQDFFDNPFSVKGIQVKVKIHPYFPDKDGLPEYFSTYYEKFVHIVTRQTVGKKGVKGKRKFKADRANRIHWLRPILENYTDARITNFSFIEADKSIRDYFWYKEKNFMVIMEEVEPDYILITGFCVDKRNLSYYRKKEQNSI